MAFNTFEILKNKCHRLLLHHVNQLTLNEIHVVFTATLQICTSATCTAKEEGKKRHFLDKCWKQVDKIVTSYLRIVSFCCGYEGITAEVQVTARVTGQANHLLGKICNIYIMVSKMMFIMLLQKKLLYLWKDQWWTRISKCCLWRKFSNSKEPQQVSSGEEHRKQTIDTL